MWGRRRATPRRRWSLTISRSLHNYTSLFHIYTDNHFITQTFWNKEGSVSETTITNISTVNRTVPKSICTSYGFRAQPQLLIELWLGDVPTVLLYSPSLSGMKDVNDAFSRRSSPSHLPVTNSVHCWVFISEKKLLGGHREMGKPFLKFRL